jgi:peroxiredoxin
MPAPLRRARWRAEVWILLVVGLVLAVSGLEAAFRATHVSPAERARRQREAFLASWRPRFPAGAPAPGFTLPDAAGTRRSLSEFRGKPTLLAFYTRDPRCAVFAREYQKIRSHTGRDRQHVVAVLDFGGEEARRWARDTGEQGVLLFETEARQRVRRLYGAGAGPAVWLLDPRGRVVHSVPPIDTTEVPERELEDLLESLRSMVPREPAGKLLPDPYAEGG